MAQLKLKQLNSVLTGSLVISGSQTVTGSLYVSESIYGDGSNLLGITSGIFQKTGSIYSTLNTLQVTGSLTVSGSTDPIFIVKGGVEVVGNIRASNSTTITGSLYVSGSYGGSAGAISASGDIVADGDVIAYNSSDERLKDNIEVIKGSLDKIGEIRGVEFDWNDKSPGWARERGHDVGVIAQEVQKIIPEIVIERKNGYLGVDYKRIVPLLIESIKELKKEVEDLKKKVN